MEALALWQAVILGLVEGITEYVPVSSTGHLVIASALMGLDRPGIKDAVDDFNIVIQGGAILAVVGLYRARFLQMLRGLAGRDPDGLRLVVNIGIAFLPAAVVGLALHGWIKGHLFSAGPVVAALVVGGVYMIVVDAWKRGQIGRRARHSGRGEGGVTDLTPGGAMKIGLLQCVSLWPGTSRSMMTITGGMMSGLSGKAAAEFSFLLGVPVLLAATGWDLYKNVREAERTGGENLFARLGVAPTVVGLAVAALAAAVAVRWLVGFLNRKGLAPFGVYRVLLGVALTGLIAGHVVRIAPERAAPVSLPVLKNPAAFPKGPAPDFSR